jgi:hypothetical protein
MLGHFSIEIMIVDGASARRAAAVRARTDLKLPDAYALATNGSQGVNPALA